MLSKKIPSLSGEIGGLMASIPKKIIIVQSHFVYFHHLPNINNILLKFIKKSF